MVVITDVPQDLNECVKHDWDPVPASAVGFLHHTVWIW